jgi:hypothetical protein
MQPIGLIPQMDSVFESHAAVLWGWAPLESVAKVLFQNIAPIRGEIKSCTLGLNLEENYLTMKIAIIQIEHSLSM